MKRLTLLLSFLCLIEVILAQHVRDKPDSAKIAGNFNPAKVILKPHALDEQGLLDNRGATRTAFRRSDTLGVIDFPFRSPNDHSPEMINNKNKHAAPPAATVNSGSNTIKGPLNKTVNIRPAHIRLEPLALTRD